MKVSNLFNVFSRRPTTDQIAPAKKLPDTFRNRVIMLCKDSFGEHLNWLNFLIEIHKRLQYLHGKIVLTDPPISDDPINDTLAFLVSCKDEYFLDFIEYMFQVDSFSTARLDETKLVDEINNFIQIDNLPFALTKFIWESEKEVIAPGYKEMRTVYKLVAYPKIIRRDDDITYNLAIEPALILLTNKKYSSANTEFLGALVDFRNKDYGDCLTKCGSAIESTLKLVCDSRGWGYNQKDTAATLIKIVVTNSDLDSFFQQQLLCVPLIRNNFSTAHGAGIIQRKPPEYIAKFAINSTAAAILFVVEACT
jgi:hypothetical protein